MNSDKRLAYKSVFGIFDTREALENAVDLLKLRGFRHDDISALLPTTESTQEFAHEKSTKAPEGATTGVVTGAALGGAMGWLAGVGLLTIPGIGPFVAAGPIIAALSGGAIGGAVGGVTGALIGFGIPEYEAKRYEAMVKDGGMLLSAHADDGDWVSIAKEIFKDAGARDISVSREETSGEAGIPPKRPSVDSAYDKRF